MVVPPGHLHTLLTQLVPFVHALPHEPQLLLSFVVFTQAFVAVQYVSLAAHAGTHCTPSHETLPPPLGAVHTVQLAPHAFVSLATHIPLGQTCIGFKH
jgi:hypothetical protein